MDEHVLSRLEAASLQVRPQLLQGAAKRGRAELLQPDRGGERVPQGGLGAPCEHVLELLGELLQGAAARGGAGDLDRREERLGVGEHGVRVLVVLAGQRFHEHELTRP